MSDFDAQDVLCKVDDGLTPTCWTIMRARKSYFYEQGFGFAFLALMLGSIPIAMAVFLIGPLTQNSLTLNENGDWTLVLVLLVLLGIAISFAWAAIYQFSQLRTIGTHVFVLTPEGCVARTGPKPYQTYGVAYAKVAAIAMSVQHSRYETNIALTLTYILGSNGHQRREQWRINRQFKASDAIAQTIIEAHTRYTVTHAPATGGQAQCTV